MWPAASSGFSITLNIVEDEVRLREDKNRHKISKDYKNRTSAIRIHSKSVKEGVLFYSFRLFFDQRKFRRVCLNSE